MAKAAESGADMYDILSNQRRRYAVHAIKQHRRPIELGALADRVSAWEGESISDDVPIKRRKSVYTALQQVHLPKMDRAEIVEFDKDAGVIEPTQKLKELDIYLEFVENNEIPWHQFYLGLALIHAAVLVALWIDVWPLTIVSGYVWGGLLVATFILSAVLHNYYMQGKRLGSQIKPPGLR